MSPPRSYNDGVGEFMGFRYDAPGVLRIAVRPELMNGNTCSPVCTAHVDRRNRTAATLRATVESDDGRLLATAIGSFSVFARRDRPSAGPSA